MPSASNTDTWVRFAGKIILYLPRRNNRFTENAERRGTITRTTANSYLYLVGCVLLDPFGVVLISSCFFYKPVMPSASNTDTWVRFAGKIILYLPRRNNRFTENAERRGTIIPTMANSYLSLVGCVLFDPFGVVLISSCSFYKPVMPSASNTDTWVRFAGKIILYLPRRNNGFTENAERRGTIIPTTANSYLSLVGCVLFDPFGVVLISSYSFYKPVMPSASNTDTWVRFAGKIILYLPRRNNRFTETAERRGTIIPTTAKAICVLLVVFC